jgi:hypothetical protein
MAARLPDLGPRFDPDVALLVKLIVVAHDSGKLWSDSQITEARQKLTAAYGEVPSPEAIAARYGPDIAELARIILDDRINELEEFCARMGIGSPCHLCGGTRDAQDFDYEFGLAANVKTKRTWGAALVTLALNIVTVPLGAAVWAGPGKRTTANIARCRLVLCNACARMRGATKRGSAVAATLDDCIRHPCFQKLYKSGYDTFLPEAELSQYS